MKRTFVDRFALWLLPRLRNVSPKVARLLKAELANFNSRTGKWSSGTTAADNPSTN